MVALIRGVHGLHGAVRAEVLTDRPEDRFVPGPSSSREGDDRPLTIASAEAVADGPGWRLRFREITSRDGADTLRGAYLEAVVRPEEDLARGSYYWHEVIGCAVRGVDGAELGTVKDIYRIGETEVFTVERTARSAASTCPPSAPSSGSSRRGGARSSSTRNRWICVPSLVAQARSRSAEGASTIARRRAPTAPQASDAPEAPEAPSAPEAPEAPSS